jgi:ABC-type spermidine/putrescine transport system permease subunit II
VKKGLDPSLNAISTVLILVTVMALFLTEALRRRNP